MLFENSRLPDSVGYATAGRGKNFFQTLEIECRESERESLSQATCPLPTKFGLAAEKQPTEKEAEVRRQSRCKAEWG
jgi:hypothetical protein